MVTFTGKQWAALRLARAPIPFTYRVSNEVLKVSIQIVDAANPAARQELRERLTGLLKSYGEVIVSDPPGEGQVSGSYTKFEGELKALLHALTGYQPTDEELKPIGDMRFDSGSEN